MRDEEGIKEKLENLSKQNEGYKKSIAISVLSDDPNENRSAYELLRRMRYNEAQIDSLLWALDLA